jgi:hypothetical protein
MFDTVVELQLKGGQEEFDADFQQVKYDNAPEDRMWMPDKKVWVIKNPHQYQNFPCIANALRHRRQQPSLF